MHAVAGAVLAAVVVLSQATPAAALRVVRPGAVSTGVRGIAAARGLSVSRNAVAALRALDVATLEAFPLGTDRTATLDVHRIRPFPANARIEVMERSGPRRLPLPDASYFAGTVRGDPESHVVLVAGRATLQGFVVTGDDVFPFGPDRAGRHRTYAASGIDPTAWPRPSEFCGNDLAPHARFRAPARGVSGAPPVAATGLRIADVAVETDNELRLAFASDEETLDYLASLLAAATAIYERDVEVRLQFSYIRLWAPEVSDPWTQTDTTNALYEYQNYWNTPQNLMHMTAGQPDVVHFISGKSVQGGVAYVDVLCNSYYGYGLSQVHGAFDLGTPTAIWDVEVLTHELGHQFGSDHTHCYSPPIDHCFNLEAGCYSGPAELSQGTIMSYCHLHPGGLANITLVFGPTVSARIGQSVAAASCLALDGAPTTTSSTTPTTTTTTTITTTTIGGATTTSSSTVTTTVVTTSTTSTTIAAAGTCDDAPDGDLVDASGCSVCPCAGPRDGGVWRNRGHYLRCVRAAARAAGLDRPAARLALRRARNGSCGRKQATRCCVATSLAASDCRVMRPAACAARGLAAEDVGPGSCDPSPC